MRFLKRVTSKISRLIFLSLLFLLFTQTHQVLADIKVSRYITTDTVWKDTTQPYVVTSYLYIQNGATLTIKPGVKVTLNSGEYIHIGNGSTGTLVAQGTEKNPITFTGNSDAPWDYLYFNAYTGEDSTLSHCVIENGGASGTGMVFLKTNNANNPTIEHCTFKNSASYPIYIGSPESLSAIDNTNAYNSNNDNRIYIGLTSFTSNGTMVNAGTPYLFSGSLYIQNNATLTIEPGVEVNLASYRQIYIGNGSTGTLVAQGTKENPITFTGSSGEPWYYLYFNADTGKGSVLRYCVIENGGASGQGMVYLNTSSTNNLTIEHCTFKNSASYPVYIGSPESLSAIDDTSTYTDNNDNRIYISFK